MQPESQRVGPVSLSERIVFIDVLRGMALFGILAANMRAFFAPLVHGLFHANPFCVLCFSTASQRVFMDGGTSDGIAAHGRSVWSASGVQQLVVAALPFWPDGMAVARVDLRKIPVDA